MANLSSLRREEWIMDSTYTEGFNSKFYGGSIPLINPTHHVFRDTERSSRGFSPMKSDMNDTLQPIMQKGLYSEPNKNFLRIRDKLKEIQEKRMIFLKPESKVPCEFAPLNTKMIYYPKWRDHSPDKWKGSNDFIHSTKAKVESKMKSYKGNKRNNSSKTEPYFDGLKAIGENKISRDTNNHENFRCFSSVIPKDPWQKRTIYSESIRADKALESLFENQRNNLKMITSSRIGSPIRVTNKNFQFQGKTINSSTSPKVINKNFMNHIRSVSTGNAFVQNSPKDIKEIEATRRKSSTARDGKMASASSKISIIYGEKVEEPKVK